MLYNLTQDLDSSSALSYFRLGRAALVFLHFYQDMIHFFDRLLCTVHNINSYILCIFVQRLQPGDQLHSES